ncbi:photosystem reaction center subunit H [Salinigranum rubrum]|uniref:Photosystem reaction center subunit H n=1 Tax=Salinigranum rubrum TaxID=755307 RepID=A0A2I8VP71_9EURY|nr:PRC-barrel domain-containing protein [Salinigranum rubrum]AUV83730.1 photosystem reaction center subunit H [Salinigranum rubrum]
MVLAENLSGKAVMGSDGAELGTLYNITMDLKTGKLHDLLVEPNLEVSSDYETDDENLLHVPVGDVQAVKDYIVVGQ